MTELNDALLRQTAPANTTADTVTIPGVLPQGSSQPQSVPEQLRRARGRLRWMIGMGLSAIYIGGVWDQLWHLSQPFDDFWSPPHLLIYLLSTIAVAIHGLTLINNQIRPAFGRGEPIRVFGRRLYPMDIPTPLLIIGWGLYTVGFAGMILDNLWHTRFGLDETSWSAPHAMLGWSMLIIMLGFITGQNVLFADRPRRWYTSLFWGWAIMGFLAGPIMGAVNGSRTLETVAAVARIPVFASQPDFLHLTQVITQWNLTRTNPLYLILAPIWLGAAFAFVRGFDKRWWVFLLIVFVWALTDSGRNSLDFLRQYYPVSNARANYEELPILLPAALLLLLMRVRVPERWAYGAAGLLFSASVYGIWGSPSFWGLLLLGPPLILIGRAFGKYLVRFTSGTEPHRVLYPLLIASVTLPILTGAIDLYLRLNTV